MHARKRRKPELRPARNGRDPAPAFRVTDWPMFYFATIERQHTRNASVLLHPFGLHHREWRVLAILNEHDGRTIGHIADVAGMEASNMSKTIDGLVRRGFVLRSTERSDRRRSLVHLTPAGRAKYEEVRPKIIDLFDRYFADMEPARFAALMELLREVKRRVVARVEVTDNRK